MRKLSDEFELIDPSFITRIEVKITFALLWSITKCIFQRKDLKITHTFTENPLINHDMSAEDYLEMALGDDWEDVMFEGELE